jgi:GNAT superfamily N-acetyltransferase
MFALAAPWCSSARRARLSGARGGPIEDREHYDALVIRTARLEDADAVQGLLTQLGYERSDDGIRYDLTSPPHGSEVIVAEIDGQVSGLLALAVRRVFQRDDPVAVIDALIVDASARSAGIGGALIRAAWQRASEQGCDRVELHSNRRRRRARRFYEAQGFTVTSNHFVRHLS